MGVGHALRLLRGPSGSRSSRDPRRASQGFSRVSRFRLRFRLKSRVKRRECASLPSFLFLLDHSALCYGITSLMTISPSFISFYFLSSFQSHVLPPRYLVQLPFVRICSCSIVGTHVGVIIIIIITLMPVCLPFVVLFVADFSLASSLARTLTFSSLSVLAIVIARFLRFFI